MRLVGEICVSCLNNFIGPGRDEGPARRLKSATAQEQGVYAISYPEFHRPLILLSHFSFVTHGMDLVASPLICWSFEELGLTLGFGTFHFNIRFFMYGAAVPIFPFKLLVVALVRHPVSGFRQAIGISPWVF